jgi:hypothetical protein
VAKLVWRVKLVAERHPGVTTETELACIERDEDVDLAELGLRLDEAKRLTAALQAQVVPAQMAALGECPRACEACGRKLAAKGHYRARFRSLFGDVPVRVRRWFVCPCRGGAGEAKSVTALDFGGDAVAPELAYVTARYAALAPFGKVAALLSELLPLGGAQHASTVRNRTLRVGAEVVQAHAAEAPDQPATRATGPVVVGLDGGYVRDRHWDEGRHFEVVAGKVIRADGAQHRFAFVRDGQVPASEAFRRALAAAGGGANTPATALGDGDAGLWRLQREVAGIGRLWQRVAGLRGYLQRNKAALVPYAARRRRGEPIATSFVESAVDEIIAWRMAKAQQMRWSKPTVQPFLDVRTAVLNDTLEHAFRRRHPGFRPANNDRRPTAAAA